MEYQRYNRSNRSSSTRAPWGRRHYKQFYESAMGQEALEVIRKHIYEGARGRNIGSSSTRGQRSSTIPEILHSGLLVGKHPTSITGIKIPLPICTGVGSIPTGNPEFRISGWGQQKQFYESARGQEAHKWREAVLRE